MNKLLKYFLVSLLLIFALHVTFSDNLQPDQITKDPVWPSSNVLAADPVWPPSNVLASDPVWPAPKKLAADPVWPPLKMVASDPVWPSSKKSSYEHT